MTGFINRALAPTRTFAAIAIAAAALLAAPARGSEATPADTARFLAGMPPSEASPLAALSKGATWRQHAQTLDRAFATVEKNTLSKARVWSAANVKAPQPTLLYMFSGPDFLFANTFYPNASTYLMVGLEPPGDIPDLMKMQRRGEVAGLGSLQNSMRTLLAVSFFITKEMREDLSSGANLRGTIPILYVFMARSGMTVREVSLVNIDDNGDVQADNPNAKTSAKGVKISFISPDGKDKTLYYFATDLANAGLKRGGFLKFAEKLGPADAFHKSASYLMHTDNFTRIRDFVVARATNIIQDDSGVPLRAFDAKKWDLYPFGTYLEPIELFPEGRQTKIAREVFSKAKTQKIDFGIGYRWRPGESNVLLAIRKPDENTKQADAR